MSIVLVNNNTPVDQPSGTSVVVTIVAPTNGNDLVACIGTSNSALNSITSIVQTGATWNKVAQVTDGANSTSEIWIALNVAGAGTSVTINFSGTFEGLAWVGEYSGLAQIAATDKTATNTDNGTGTVDSGTTSTTTNVNELWIACLVAFDRGGGFNETPTNGFSSTSSLTGSNISIEVCTKIVSTVGTANTSDVDSGEGSSSGVIATFLPLPVAVIPLKQNKGQVQQLQAGDFVSSWSVQTASSDCADNVNGLIQEARISNSNQTVDSFYSAIVVADYEIKSGDVIELQTDALLEII